MSNPIFNRVERESRSGYAGFDQRPVGGMTAGYPMQDQLSTEQLQHMYDQPSALRRPSGVTLDDVIMKTGLLFALVLGFGAVGWVTSDVSPATGQLLWMGGMVGTLVLGLVIAFKKTVSVPLIVLYAAIEGLFIGAVSGFFADYYEGVVTQAVLATAATFAGMLLAYKTGLIKVTAKFRRIVTMMVFGYILFALANLAYAMIANVPFGFGGTSALGIGISLFAVGLAAVTLALDFDSIEGAIASGAPKKYSWLLAHGLIVSLVWLYLEFLRLFARLQSND
ncbi:Bax inhibitor-1/YccA family protein [Actinomycetota bacterium]